MRKFSSEIEPVLAVLKEPAIFLNIDERLPVCKVPSSIKSRVNKPSRGTERVVKTCFRSIF